MSVDNPHGVMELYLNSPFAPTISTFGTTNHDAAYTIKMATTAVALKDTPPPVLELDDNVVGTLDGLPRNYYPPKARPEFDYDISPMFRRAGKVRV